MIMHGQSDEKAREDFFADIGKRLNDTVLSVEMVCLEAEIGVFDLLKLTPAQKNAGLWGLLVICEKNFCFYAHPTESAILGLFRSASGGKPPAEQLCSFSDFKAVSFREVERIGLFGKRYEKYLLAADAVLNDGTNFSFYLRTQNKAARVLQKIMRKV